MKEQKPDTVDSVSLTQKLHSETAKMSWIDLQRFFAQGKVIHIAQEMDLIEVASDFAEDNASKIDALINGNKIQYPSNDQAREWFNKDSQFWTVVIAPYVLIQVIA